MCDAPPRIVLDLEWNMKPSFATAVVLVFLVSPALAQSHHERMRTAPAGGSEVTVGSGVRITDIGEVIGPTDAIISVTKDPPGGYRGRPDAKQTIAPAK